MIYKKRGNTTRVMLRRIATHDEEAARVLLKQAGMDSQEIERFVANYKARH